VAIAVPNERAVLLTGANGFLGSYLVAELLAQTAADVICLVRGAGAEEATARLRQSLAEYGLWNDAAAARVRALPGDLARPLLGLSEARFGALATEIDAIYHNGAWVNVSYPYSALKAANVLGTQEILRLAFRERLKPVSFVSTIGVFFAPEFQTRALVEEDGDLGNPMGVASGEASGYAQSKWVGERLVAEARKRGLPVSIFRFGRAAWHSQSGAWNKNDALRNVLETCLQLGSFPDVEANLDLAPVDYLARAIVALSRQGRSPGRNFHLLSEQEISWRQLVEWLQQLGQPIELLPFADWLNRGKSQGSAAALPHLLRLGGMAMAPPAALADPAHFADPDPARPRFLRRTYDTRNVRAGLAGSGIACPEIDAASLQLFLARYGAARLAGAAHGE
jgi:thioester reductase-like protein